MILTKGKVKDKEHLKLRYLVPVGRGPYTVTDCDLLYCVVLAFQCGRTCIMCIGH